MRAYLAFEIIVACKEQATGDGEGNGCDTAQYLIALKGKYQ